MEVKKVTGVYLELTPNEAHWLKSVMQNPLWGQTPEEEDSFDTKMRETFFNALEWDF